MRTWCSTSCAALALSSQSRPKVPFSPTAGTYWYLLAGTYSISITELKLFRNNFTQTKYKNVSICVEATELAERGCSSCWTDWWRRWRRVRAHSACSRRWRNCVDTELRSCDLSTNSRTFISVSRTPFTRRSRTNTTCNTTACTLRSIHRRKTACFQKVGLYSKWVCASMRIENQFGPRTTSELTPGGPGPPKELESTYANIPSIFRARTQLSITSECPQGPKKGLSEQPYSPPTNAYMQDIPWRTEILGIASIWEAELWWYSEELLFCSSMEISRLFEKQNLRLFIYVFVLFLLSKVLPLRNLSLIINFCQNLLTNRSYILTDPLPDSQKLDSL